MASPRARLSRPCADAAAARSAGLSNSDAMASSSAAAAEADSRSPHATRDLHPGGQQLGAGEPVPGLLVERAHDDGGGGVGSALGETQEREPRLWPTAERFGLAERELGSVEVPDPAPHLAQLHETGRGVHGAHTYQLRARPHPLLLGAGPLAAPLQGPRPMHPAQPREHGERVALGPARRRVRPLGHPPVVAELLAGADQAAVDLAGRVRPEPSLDCEQHRLVEVREPVLGAALVHEDSTDGLERFRFEVDGAQAPGELDDRLRLLGGEVELTAAVRDLGLPQHQVAVLGALDVALEPMTGPAQPRPADAGLGLEAVVLVEPHRALRGLPAGIALVEDREGGLARLDALVHPSQPPRRLGACVQPSRLAERIIVVARHRPGRVVGGLPVVAGQRLASRDERAAPPRSG